MITLKERAELEKKFGKCCNTCVEFYTCIIDEPCDSCEDFSHWESCKERIDEK